MYIILFFLAETRESTVGPTKKKQNQIFSENALRCANQVCDFFAHHNKRKDM